MSQTPADPLVFSGGSVLDVVSGQVVDAELAVADGRIIEIGRGLASGRTVDIDGLTLVPGVIDAHVHLLTTRVDVWRLATAPLSYRICEAVDNLAVTLAAGVTTVRDAGGIDAGVAMASNSGLVQGPRVQASIGMLCQTGGHADGWTLSGVEIPTLFPRFPGMPRTVVDGPDEIRRAARELVRAGAEVIKVATSGGALSPRDNPADRHFDDEELSALRVAAAAAGLKVMAHAHSNEGIKAALRAGVASIEHGVWLDDEAIETMVRQGTFLVPTLGAPQSVLDDPDAAGLGPEAVAQVREMIEAHRDSFKRAVEAGVKIAMGTDSGVIAHGRNLEELKLMEDAGCPAIDCWRAATVGAAELLGLDGVVGALGPGMVADMVAITGDPLDLSDLRSRVAIVVKGGVPVGCGGSAPPDCSRAIGSAVHASPR